MSTPSERIWARRAELDDGPSLAATLPAVARQPVTWRRLPPASRAG